MKLFLVQMVICFCVSFLSASYVYAGCSVSTTSINFGTYDVFSSTASTGTGSITLSCTPKADISIAIIPTTQLNL